MSNNVKKKNQQNFGIDKILKNGEKFKRIDAFKAYLLEARCFCEH